MSCHVRLALAPLLALACSIAVAQPAGPPNGDFEQGGDGPEGWTLSGGDGAWVRTGAEGSRALEVTGTGAANVSNYWRSGPLDLAPSAVYQLRFHARRPGGGASGCAISGPVFANRDVTGLDDAWRDCMSTFATPDRLDAASAWLRFGQWEVDGKVAWDNVALLRVTPVHRQRADGLTLGEGERVSGATYRFTAPLGEVHGNFARPLLRHRCVFNTQRWVFDSADRQVVYRHDFTTLGHAADAARVTVDVGYHTGGTLHVYASVPGGPEALLGTLDAVGSDTFEVPAALLPATVLDVRLTGSDVPLGGGGLADQARTSQPGAFQVYGYGLEADLSGDAGDLEGATVYVAEEASDGRVAVTPLGLGMLRPGEGNVLRLGLANRTDRPVNVTPTLVYARQDGPDYRRRDHRYALQPLTLAPGASRPVSLPFNLEATGDLRFTITLGDQSPYRATARLHVPAYYAVDYGERLPDSGETAGLWWASSGWKVWPDRPLPDREGLAVQVALAMNETEAAQFVLRPQAALPGLTVSPGAFEGMGRALPDGCVEVLRVAYVDVDRPTDDTGVRGPWPDPLPPLDGPVDLEAGRNHPFWVRVRVPEGVLPGLYRGAIRLDAEGYAAQVPLNIEVYGFALPTRMSCTTAFGVSPSNIFRYHGVTDPIQRRQVWDHYLETLAAHHISPYDPAPLDPIRFTWPGASAWEGAARDGDVRHAGETSARIEDQSDSANQALHLATRVPLRGKGVRLAFDYRAAAPGHRFTATLMHYRADGSWISGGNTDVVVEGDEAWRRMILDHTAWPEGADRCAVTVWATEWSEQGAGTGTVWVDDLKVTELPDGAVLLEEGFEPLSAADLAPDFDWTDWDAAMSHAIDQLGVNSFRLTVPGMGGGTFHDRVEPSLLGYGEDTPQYKTAFTAWCRAVEAHLEEKGWLDEAYVYWFDEPDPKDYAFVMNGFEKLRAAAPGLRGMLTEQVEAELVGGPTIWCPLTPAYDAKLAGLRREQGDAFWWYVCTAPKAPCVTLFIDHPGTEMRVWGWQTWQRGITGLLVWETTYWHSPTAYTDTLQNPWEDPMGWTTGYGVAPGTRLPWGNGDGRFLYPPRAAADGNPAAPVLEPPVTSIRLAMLRDGIEDYEYLAMLRQLLAEKRDRLTPATVAEVEALLRVPEDITEDLTRFTDDPAPIEARRDALARAIVSLMRVRAPRP